MKIVVDLMPNSPRDCLFCKDIYRETCRIDGDVCPLADWSDIIKEKEEDKICPYLIELNEVNK
nr:MAG TPA: hypothetical protein [Caudoviricetes sp.]